MSNSAVSIIKILVAISCLCIPVVANNFLVLPIFFILLLGLSSIFSGDFFGFFLSIFGLISAVYLIVSALIDKRKINLILSTISIAILVLLAVYSISSSDIFPFYSILSYTIFFSCH